MLCKYAERGYKIAVRANILNGDIRLLFAQIYTERWYKIAVRANILNGDIRLLFAQIY